MVDAKLKPGEICYWRADELLAIKWCDKRAVLILSTIHEAVEIPTSKKDRFDQPIIKPEAVHEYTKNMRGCDLADQLINSYCMIRRTCKWWLKIFFHLFAACICSTAIEGGPFSYKLPPELAISCNMVGICIITQQ